MKCRFLLDTASGPFVNKIESLRDITFACLSQIIQGFELARETRDPSHNLECIGRGYHGLLPYAYEYWVDHLLEYLDVSGGFTDEVISPLEKQLVKLSRECRQLAEETNTPSPTPDGPDKRLGFLDDFREAQSVVNHVIEFRNTKQTINGMRAHLVPTNLKLTRLVEDTPSTADVKLLCSIRATYQRHMTRILLSTECPGLSVQELITFKEEFGPFAFTCLVPGCDRSVVGFSSATRLKDHEARHQDKLKCRQKGCSYNDVGFTSRRALREHISRIHESPKASAFARQLFHQKLHQAKQHSLEDVHRNILEPIVSTKPNAESGGPKGNVPDDGQTSSSFGAIGSSAAAAKPKVSFQTGDDVAFKRKNDKPLPPELPYDWIQGRIVAVIGEGKSKRYKCVDIDDMMREEYRTSASGMIRIPSETEELEILEAGAMVLGLYPATTAFYAADVVVTDLERDMVSLNFHGEKDSNYAHEVERRFVLPYRP